MIIKKFPCMPLDTNTYLVCNGSTKQAIVIDPSFNSAKKILETAQELNVKIKYIINTHSHFDHIWDNAELQKKTDAKIIIHKLEAQNLKNPNVLDFKPPYLIKPSTHDMAVSDGDKIFLGDITLQVIHTPGHSPGGICLHEKKEKILLSGDTLFKSTYGRTDIPGADQEAMIKSLKKLLKLPEETKVYPGHGEDTTIANEKDWIEKL